MEINDIHPQGSPSPEGHGHEARGTNIRNVLIFAVSLAVAIVVFQVALAAWLGGLRDDRQRTDADRPELLADEDGLYPGPPLQQTATGDMRRMARVQARELNTYGWVEPGKVARIPIQRAMNIVANQGLDQSGPESTATDPQSQANPGGDQ